MKKIYTLFLALIFSNAMLAQFNAGINGLALLPQGEFKDNIGTNGYGFSASGFYHFEETPFSLGATIGWARYGSETRTETLVWPVKVEVTTANDIAFMHLFGRLEHNIGIVRPYAEFNFGLNYLNTNTEINDIDDYDDDSIADDTQFDDTDFSYGFAIGTMFNVYTQQEVDAESSLSKVFIDLKLSYSLGGKAEYLNEGDLERGQNNEIILNTSQSNIDYLTLQLGVNFEFRAQ